MPTYPTTHGQSDTRLYFIWAGAKTRATNRNRDSSKSYVDRGIGICEEWLRFEPFRDWAIANGYQDDLTIERKDVDGDYEPNNCCWVPMKDQARNRTTTLHITAFGETKLALDWALDPRCRCTAFAIYKRVDRGWEPETAITTPPKKIPVEATAFGETKLLTEWARDARARASWSAIRQRIRNGWNAEDSITTPGRITSPLPAITAFGETKAPSEWARDPRAKVSYETLVMRIKRGWEPEKSITTPCHQLADSMAATTA